MLSLFENFSFLLGFGNVFIRSTSRNSLFPPLFRGTPVPGFGGPTVNRGNRRVLGFVQSGVEALTWATVKVLFSKRLG